MTPLMTALLTLTLGGSLLWLAPLLRTEGLAAAHEAAALLQEGMHLPESIIRIPWPGPWLQERLLELGADRTAFSRQLSEWATQWGGRAMRLVGDLGLNRDAEHAGDLGLRRSA